MKQALNVEIDRVRICDGWDAFLEEIKRTELPLVCFGAGSLPWLLEPFFERVSVWDKIVCFLDNDREKSGLWIGESKKIPVFAVDEFRETGLEDFLMLITCEAYSSVLEQLQEIEEWSNIHCYLYIHLNYEIVKRKDGSFSMLSMRKAAIPKVIHYCWFGHQEKGEMHRKCIQSWREKCPDYEIVEWNEENYDIHQCSYMEEAYAIGKWAYVSDFARLDILYRYGGIYLDTDVELIANPDVLLSEDGFIAYGQWPAVNSGAGIGCVSGLPIIKEMRDDPRKDISFLKSDGSLNMLQNGFYESRILRRYGFVQDFSGQCIENLRILPPEIMATESILGEKVFVTVNTIAIHHCIGSWVDNRTIEERNRMAERCQRAKT